MLKQNWKPITYYTFLVLAIFWLAFFNRPEDAQGDDEFTPAHLRDDSSPWNSGALDARGGNPSGYDGSGLYGLEYANERDEMLQEQIEELNDE